MKLVSIIIPVFNVEKYIEKCIESVLVQDYIKLEIVIVDDGSTDNSIEVIKKYSDSRIKVFSKTNGGLSSARNYGIRNSNGEYIFFLDSDDWIEPNTISSLVKEMNDGIDIVQGSIRRVSENASVNVLLNRERVSNCVLLEYFKKEKLNTVVWNKLYRREIIEDIQFYENFVNEDVIFTFQIARKEPNIMNIENIIYDYRIRSGSIMHKKKLIDRMRVIKSLDVVIEECKQLNKNYLQLAYYDKYITLIYLFVYSHIGELEYDRETFDLLLKEIDYSKQNFKITNIIKCVNTKQFFTIYIPSCISKKLVAILYRIKGRNQ